MNTNIDPGSPATGNVTVVVELAANAIDTAILSAGIVDGENEKILFAGVRQIGNGDVASLIFKGEPIGNGQKIFRHVSNSASSRYQDLAAEGN
jgi:hypothetical protein